MKGKTNEIADALSRAPVFPSHEKDESSSKAYICYELHNNPTISSYGGTI